MQLLSFLPAQDDEHKQCQYRNLQDADRLISLSSFANMLEHALGVPAEYSQMMHKCNVHFHTKQQTCLACSIAVVLKKRRLSSVKFSFEGARSRYVQSVHCLASIDL